MIISEFPFNSEFPEMIIFRLIGPGPDCVLASCVFAFCGQPTTTADPTCGVEQSSQRNSVLAAVHAHRASVFLRGSRRTWLSRQHARCESRRGGAQSCCCSSCSCRPWSA